MDATLWPYGKCKKCTHRNYCGWSNTEIANCMNNGYQNFSPEINADHPSDVGRPVEPGKVEK